MVQRAAALCALALLLAAGVHGAKPDGLGQFDPSELDPGIDELPGGRSLVAHIVPLHSDEGSLLEAAAVAWQPDPGLDVLRGGEAGLLPAAGEEEPGREQAISFGFEDPSMFDGGLESGVAAAPAAAAAAAADTAMPTPAAAGAAQAPAPPEGSLAAVGAALNAAVAAGAAGVRPSGLPALEQEPKMLVYQDAEYLQALPDPAAQQEAAAADALTVPAAAVGSGTKLGRFKVRALPPYPLQANRPVGFGDLVPTVHFSHNHWYLYQVPPNPRAVALMIHGCAGTAFNWWPQSAACNNCRGMPEQMSHTIQALARGYAVIAISAGDMSTGCWSWNDDSGDVRDLLKSWLKLTNLGHLPLYGLGVSSGASFVLKLPRYFKFSGILSEALGIDPEPWALDKVDGHYPPTIFVSMVKDQTQGAKISNDYSILKQRGSPVAIIKVYERLVYATYFSDRHPYNISVALSSRICQGLLDIRMIDASGRVLEEPRKTKRPWLAQLQRVVPELGGVTEWEKGRALPQWPESSVNMNAKAVWSLMNLAYAQHEIISDYATVAFAWFETGGQANLKPLLQQLTYGRPPWQRKRIALEEPAAGMPVALHEQPAAQLSAAAQASGRGAAEQLSADASVAWLGGVQASSAVSQAAGTAVAGDAALLEAAQAAEAALLLGDESALQPLPSSPLAGGVARCAGALALVAGLAWLVGRRSHSGAQASSLLAGGAMQAAHPLPPSLIPGVRERFDLTEVLEQTGSPFSARRRARTAFHADAPAPSALSKSAGP